MSDSEEVMEVMNELKERIILKKLFARHCLMLLFIEIIVLVEVLL